MTFRRLLICVSILFTQSIAAQNRNADLANLSGGTGFTIKGAAAEDRSGAAVSNAGDTNGDGLDDIIVASYMADPLIAGTVKTNAGIVYVIFGRRFTSGASSYANIDLATLNSGGSTLGFAIISGSIDDLAGHSVGGAGDVNSDGLADVIVGGVLVDPLVAGVVRGDSGVSFVIFGRKYTTGASSYANIYLSNIVAAGSQLGFAVIGATTGAYSGFSVSGAGDVNKDGIDDIIIGAKHSSPTLATVVRTNAGTAHVIFGRNYSTGANSYLNVDLLNLAVTGSPVGFTMYGDKNGDLCGGSVSGAGDVNGDGVADVIVGCSSADQTIGGNLRPVAGVSYVIFGRRKSTLGAASYANIDLRTVASQGFAISGAEQVDASGTRVSKAGDVNGDGYADVLVGSPGANAIVDGVTTHDCGIAYVIFGRAGIANVDLAIFQIPGANVYVGFAILGIAPSDNVGNAVSEAGDVNGDGIDDILVGVLGANAVVNGVTRGDAGLTYIIYGRKYTRGVDSYTNMRLIDIVGDSLIGYVLYGAAAIDLSGSAVSAAGDVNGDGMPDLLVGALQSDLGGFDSGAAYVVFGVMSTPTSQPSSQPSDQPSMQPYSHPSSQPSAQPSVQPSSQPSCWPTGQPTRQPTSQPLVRPTAQPSTQPTSRPSGQPSSQPSNWPSSQPTWHPTTQPSALPSQQPTASPTGQPSSQPSIFPTTQPSTVPSIQPSSRPSAQPSAQPSLRPSGRPTLQPVAQPSSLPTAQPTGQPSQTPSQQPTSKPTVKPTAQPSPQPSGRPTSQPSARPSMQPTANPTIVPSAQPTVQPSSVPSANPSVQPTARPTTQPSARPTVLPSSQPSAQPSGVPTVQPSVQPSSQPSTRPSVQPTSQPTLQSTSQPTCTPTVWPSAQPSAVPTITPSLQPSSSPSTQPSNIPSAQPSVQPSSQPSAAPTQHPSVRPTGQPSTQPSQQPLAMPTSQPSSYPSAQPTQPTTGEWVREVSSAAVFNTLHSAGDVLWSCGEEALCVVVDAAQGNMMALYQLGWSHIATILSINSQGGVIITGACIADTTMTSNVAICSLFQGVMHCSGVSYHSSRFVAASYVPYPKKVVYIGWHNVYPSVTVVDLVTNLAQSYLYTASNVKALTISKLQSPPYFMGSFVAGTAIRATATPVNYIVAGMVRTDAGILSAMTLTPQTGDIVNYADLVKSMALEVTGPDSFIAGGLQLDSYPGTHAYMMRVNALFMNVQYCMRYSHASSGSNRRLSDAAPLTGSVVQALALVDTVLFLAISITRRNNKHSLTLLKTSASNGAIINQVHILSPNTSLLCTDMVVVQSLLRVMCSTDSNVSVLLSVDSDFTLSEMPLGFERSDKEMLQAERVPFKRSVLNIAKTAVTIPTSTFEFTTSGTTPSQQPLHAPSSQPSTQPTMKPSSQPSSIPTTAPSVSPQPTSTPSTATPTSTRRPTEPPTDKPTTKPTAIPTTRPSLRPTQSPTIPPTLQPSAVTVKPSTIPSPLPTRKPSLRPSTRPLALPTTHPTQVPSIAATVVDSSVAESRPSDLPSYFVGACVGGGLGILLVCYTLYRYVHHKEEEKAKDVRRKQYYIQQAMLVAQHHAEMEKYLRREAVIAAEQAEQKKIAKQNKRDNVPVYCGNGGGGGGGGAYATGPIQVVQSPNDNNSDSVDESNSAVLSSLHSSEISSVKHSSELSTNDEQCDDSASASSVYFSDESMFSRQSFGSNTDTHSRSKGNV